MIIDYKVFKLSFVNFLSEEGYKTYASRFRKENIYLYSFSKENQIVKISDKYDDTLSNDKELDYLKDKIAKQKNIDVKDVKVIEVYFDKKRDDQMITRKNCWIFIGHDLDGFKENIRPFFTNIDNMKIEDETKVSESEKSILDNTNVQEDILENPAGLEKNINSFAMKIKNRTSPGAIIFELLFILIPIVTLVISMVWGFANSDVNQLAFGGTNYFLTIEGGQGWRILTYGFVANTGNWAISILLIILVAFPMYKINKINDLVMKPWKFIVAFMIAYVLVGYFSSVFSLGGVTGGLYTILAITTGMLALNVSGRKSVVSLYSKTAIIWPIILLIIMPAFYDGGAYNYIPMIVGFCAGGVVGYLFTYDYSSLNWRLALPIIVLLALILIPSIMLAIPSYVSAPDAVTVYVLNIYINKGVMSVEHANSLVNKIGWEDIKWQDFGGLILIPSL